MTMRDIVFSMNTAGGDVVVQGVSRLAPPTRPFDGRPPVMNGHFCMDPRVSVHDRYYCRPFLNNTGDYSVNTGVLRFRFIDEEMLLFCQSSDLHIFANTTQSINLRRSRDGSAVWVGVCAYQILASFSSRWTAVTLLSCIIVLDR